MASCVSARLTGGVTGAELKDLTRANGKKSAHRHRRPAEFTIPGLIKYSKVAHCKLYTSKKPITATGLLNDRVLPFYDTQGLPMLRILADRGTEYCG